MGKLCKIGFWSTLKGLIRILSYLGQNGAMLKPGEAPICEEIKQQNQLAHSEMRRYIADVDSRSAAAVRALHDDMNEGNESLRDDMKENNQTLRGDINSRLDQLIAIIKAKS
jgi:hypothetical protein